MTPHVSDSLPRLGLCCTFMDPEIRFRRTTAAALLRLRRPAALQKLAEIALHNAEALGLAIGFCANNGIGAFRINSQILPVFTHPEVGYAIDELPDADRIVFAFKAAGALARERGIRTLFHPDQFIVLNSPNPAVVAASIAEIEYQACVSEWVNADVINLHAGGAYGDKATALATLHRALDRLSPRVRARLTLENDDRMFTPSDLLPLCHAAHIPLVYDVHHHRCLPDGMSIADATAAAQTTWEREPVFHISSPLAGWGGPRPHRHHDYIDLRDFPRAWDTLPVTIEVEAKAKERAIAKLQKGLQARRRRAQRS